MEFKKMVTITLYINRKRDTDVQNRLLDSVGKARVGCSKRIALKQVYYQG